MLMLSQFLQWLVSLIERLNSKPVARVTGDRLMESKHGVLLQLNTDEPGVIAQYKIIDSRAADDLLISLIGVAQYKEDAGRLYSYKRSTDPLPIRVNSAFNTEFAEFCKTHGCRRVLITHVLYVAWQSRIIRSAPGRKKKTEGEKRRSSQRSYIIRPIIVLPCDLQGVRPLVGDRAALRIVRAVATSVFKLDCEDWAECVSRVDWRDWVATGAKKVLGSKHEI